MCQQKEELFHVYSEAMETLSFRLRMQTDAVVAGDPEFGRFDGPIDAAKQRKMQASRAYHSHLRDHGCGGCPFNARPLSKMLTRMAESVGLGVVGDTLMNTSRAVQV